MPDSSFTRTFLTLLSGPIVWALYFSAIYGAHTLACIGGTPTQSLAASLGLLTALATGILAIMFFASPSLLPRSACGANFAFLRTTTRLLLLVSSVAIALSGGVLMFLSACSQLR